MARLNEFDLIATLLRPLAAVPEALNLEDDAAIIPGSDGLDWVIAKDAIVENVHFRSEDPADTVACKLLGTNLSDLAAMGAEPAHYLSVIARPPGMGDPWLTLFCQGLKDCQERFGITLLGGDTVSTQGPMSFCCTILGQLPKGTALKRSDAKEGDLIFVSGTVGDAAMGLRILNGLAATDDDRVALTKRYQVPEPRLSLGKGLRGLASACIDVSDGLAADIGHIAKASNISARINLDDLPLSATIRHMPGARAAALCGGDDYELAFTAPPAHAQAIRDLSARTGTPVTEIGMMTQGHGVELLDGHGERVELKCAGWQHS